MNHAQRTMAIRAAQAASRGRRIALSPLLVAANGASRLTPAELRHITGPMTDAVRAFRRAAGTYADWLRLCTARNVGQAIEDGGVVRGLQEILDDAHTALLQISWRMETANGWQPSALHAPEIRAIANLVEKHTFQLRQLSYTEYQTAYRLATSRVRSDGGECVKLQQEKQA